MPAAAPSLAVLLAWLAYMGISGAWGVVARHWSLPLTMAAGSFIAGATAEGGGAVAFPVMTLVLGTAPEVARNFALAIQSVGMGCASWLILRRGYAVDRTYLAHALAGGAAGLVLGALFIAPRVPPAEAKMLFVAIWLSFGAVLWHANRTLGRSVAERLPELGARERARLAAVGALGGVVSSVFGTGIDILTFSYVTLRHRLSERVATPTSVVAMAAISVMGTILHLFVLGDVTGEAVGYWLACVPVVVVGAPLGAYYASTRPRTHLADLLCLVIAVQFIGAWLVIRPSGALLWSTAAAFLGGLGLFAWARRAGERDERAAA